MVSAFYILPALDSTVKFVEIKERGKKLRNTMMIFSPKALTTTTGANQQEMKTSTNLSFIQHL